ncbi:helix-turn-helix domain-containing protein [Thermomonospora catenispora]|uniref:helix-turn-helix domain-containing protein n=1 Tax=Thermomonospora catenispora TaxID=2493090 RepID=UPI00111E470B|nr:helix-turn-helix transcriptional regulator [Thermomonospora catenispora]TNY37475.1 XRE family transcriptional regulator [Thermomonospora catenispora]
MFSPYVRRLRLAEALRKLREDRNLTADEVAKTVFQSRGKLSKLETAQTRPEAFEIMGMLERLNVTGKEYDKIIHLARTAAQKGWWDQYAKVMGPRQRLYADLESGAETIRSYNQTAMPAALQHPDFISAMIALDECQGPLDYIPERMAEARARRQQHLLKEDGPTYEAVLDECVLHRLAVPAEVMAVQLRHLVSILTDKPQITIRILPHNVPIPGGFLPKSSFSLYTFPDPADPQIAVVDTVTTDLILTQRREVARYTGVYNRVREAALPPAESLAFLERMADRLIEQKGSGL